MICFKSILALNRLPKIIFKNIYLNTKNPVWVVNFSQFLKKKKKRKEEKFKISKIFRLVSTCCLIMREVSCDFG